MNVLVKMSQSHTMYIAKYINARKIACLAFNNLYTMREYLIGPTFNNWTTIIDIESIEKYLKFDEKRIQFMVMSGYVVPIH